MWQSLGLREPAHDLFAALEECYAEPHRAYHTAQHIEECLGWLDRVRHRCEQPAEVEIGLWFHDAIYEPRQGRNEERSAEWAARELAACGGPERLQSSIRSLILITRHDVVPTARDEQLLVDIDLSILGAPPSRFTEYEAQVRKEYAFVPEEIFRSARAGILQRLLSRPSIYSTEVFREMLEAQARANLKASIVAMNMHR